METSFVTLSGHQLHRLAAPVRIRTESGLLWVTVDGELEDILLAAGECRRFDRPGAAVVAYALGGEARFEAVDEGADAARHAQPWMAKARAWLRGARPALGGHA